MKKNHDYVWIVSDMLKLLRIMKLTVFLLTLMFVQSFASSYAQTTEFNFTMEDATIKEVIEHLEQESEFYFFLKQDQEILNKKVDVVFEDNSIEQVLDKLLENTSLSYKIVDKYIAITPQGESDDDIIPLEKKREIRGKVTDETGMPLPGVSIVVKGSLIGVTTNIEGNYTLKISEDAQILVFSFVGMKDQEVVIAEQTLIDVVMREEAFGLDEVIAVGYGIQRKRDVTTSISSLKSSELLIPVTSVDQAMAGKLSGVQVTQPNGIPGGGMSIKVRGTGSISAGNEPLYVLDGFPMSDLVGNGTGIKVNPLSSINMNDIESIEVLKDASASAIYGSRGANGVVIITTKKGKEGKPVIKYDGYLGWQQTTKKIKMLNAYDWAKLFYDSRNNTYLDALAKKGLTGSITDTNEERLAKFGRPLTDIKQKYTIPDLVLPYLNDTPGLTDTDWQDEVLRTGFVHNHNLSIAGGNKTSQYFISTNYRKEEGIVIGSGFEQIGARAKLNGSYNRFSYGANLSFNHSIYDLVPTENRFSKETILSTALGMIPALPVYDKDGNYDFTQYTLNHRIPTLINPVALANLREDNMKRNRFLGTLYAEYEFIKDLKFKSSFGVDYNSFRRNIYRPSSLPTKVNNIPPSISTGENRTKDVINWLWENTLTYNFTLGNDHSFSAIAGWTVQNEMSDSGRTTATGFPNDLVHTLNASTAVTKWDTYREEWALLSGLARIQYNYKNKYLFSAAFRSDGSSRFGTENRWGFFPSVSAGWYITEEKFMKDKLDWISSLKFRGSYGLSGNFSIGNYEYYAGVGADNYVLGEKEILSPGLYPSTSGNPELGWEKTAMTNIGLEIGLFEMILLELDFYNGNTTDMLLNVPVPEFSGFSTVRQNIGKVNNKGFEVSLSTNNTWGKFTWSNRLNFSMNKNEVVDLGGVNEIISKGETMEFVTRVGEKIGNYYALITDGVFLNQNEVNIANDLNDHRIAKVPNAHPGDFKFVDVNGDGVIDGNDKTIVGNYMPDFTYGFSTQLKYRWFDLSMDLQGVYGNEVANINRRYLNNMEGGSNQIDALNRWVSEENPGNGETVRANRSQTGMNGQMSTWHIEDGSYLRVKNITFGVTMPDKWVKSMNLSNARLYFSAQNPFTFTNYSGYNPEVNMKGNALTPGIDYGTYPLSKSMVVGVNLTF